eukprot:gene16600-19718_t
MGLLLIWFTWATRRVSDGWQNYRNPSYIVGCTLRLADSAKTTPEPSARDTEPATRSPAQAAASEPPSGPAEPTEEVDGRAVSVKGDSGEGREADELPQLSQEGEKDLALKRALANDMKSRANAKYKEKQFELAIDLYTEAIDLTGNRNFVLFTNRAAGYYQLGRQSVRLLERSAPPGASRSWALRWRLGADARRVPALRMEDCVNDCETALRLGQKHPELTDSNTMHRASLRK